MKRRFNVILWRSSSIRCSEPRTGGDIPSPSLVEFFGTWWNGDGVWICFQPACRYSLWIEPSFWAGSMRALFDHQAPDGRVPQGVASYYYDTPLTQIPNISSVLHDYYVFTGDRAFLQYSYPKLKKWYEWFLAKRNPTGDSIIAVGDPTLDQYQALCEYKDNGTDPTSPTFQDVCNPLTRTIEIGGRPERVYLPDIVACQARMAEDLAMMAKELGLKEDAAHFTAEYRRIRDWANRTLWDEKTRFYYPVARKSGKKLMKRSNAAFWLLWAGIPNKDQKDALVAAMFDPKQFFTTIPLPMIALDDPSSIPSAGIGAMGTSGRSTCSTLSTASCVTGSGIERPNWLPSITAVFLAPSISLTPCQTSSFIIRVLPRDVRRWERRDVCHWSSSTICATTMPAGPRRSGAGLPLNHFPRTPGAGIT